MRETGEMNDPREGAAMPEKYCLEVSHLSAGYGTRPAVRDITFSVRPGEILAVIGPNGAGKSTILKALCGQLEPSAGAIYLDGQLLHGDADGPRMQKEAGAADAGDGGAAPVSGGSLPGGHGVRRGRKAMSGQEAARRMAVLLTERVRPELMTCEDVAASGRYPYTGKLGVLHGHDRQIVREALERVNMWDLRDRDFSQTSDGQKQMVLFARAICQEPELMVLDEPTSYLDIHYKVELLTILRELVREKGMAAVLSLHELDLAGQTADKVLCVKNGRAERCDAPEKIFQGGYIRQLYGIPEGCFDEKSRTVILPPLS